MTNQEAKALYEGKYFYEVLGGSYLGKSCKMLFGPMDTIYFANTKSGEESDLKYVQVINNKCVQAFRENEILVTDHIL